MCFRNRSIIKDCKIVLSKSKRSKIYSLHKYKYIFKKYKYIFFTEKNINIYLIKLIFNQKFTFVN